MTNPFGVEHLSKAADRDDELRHATRRGAAVGGTVGGGIGAANAVAAGRALSSPAKAAVVVGHAAVGAGFGALANRSQVKLERRQAARIGRAVADAQRGDSTPAVAKADSPFLAKAAPLGSDASVLEIAHGRGAHAGRAVGDCSRCSTAANKFAAAKRAAHLVKADNKTRPRRAKRSGGFTPVLTAGGGAA